MRAKQYLKRIKRLDSFIRQKEEEIAELEIRIHNVGGADFSTEKVQSSPDPDKILNGLIKLQSYKERYVKALNELYALKAEAERLIELVPNDDYKLLLTLRYFKFKTFEEIAVEMNFTFQWVHELHKRALKCFDDLIEIDIHNVV